MSIKYPLPPAAPNTRVVLPFVVGPGRPGGGNHDLMFNAYLKLMAQNPGGGTCRVSLKVTGPAEIWSGDVALKADSTDWVELNTYAAFRQHMPPKGLDPNAFYSGYWEIVPLTAALYAWVDEYVGA